MRLILRVLSVGLVVCGAAAARAETHIPTDVEQTMLAIEAGLAQEDSEAVCRLLGELGGRVSDWQADSRDNFPARLQPFVFELEAVSMQCPPSYGEEDDVPKFAEDLGVATSTLQVIQRRAQRILDMPCISRDPSQPS